MIFHIFGGQCSGKTSVVKELDPNLFAHWDIYENFYIPELIIWNNKMNWEKWRFREHKIENAIKNFFEANKDKHIIIESSGLNKNVNRVIKTLGKIVPINMGIPTDEESKNRAITRGLLPKQVIEFNNITFLKFTQLSKYLPTTMQIESAVKFILDTVKGEEI